MKLLTISSILTFAVILSPAFAMSVDAPDQSFVIHRNINATQAQYQFFIFAQNLSDVSSIEFKLENSTYSQVVNPAYNFNTSKTCSETINTWGGSKYNGQKYYHCLLNVSNDLAVSQYNITASMTNSSGNYSDYMPVRILPFIGENKTVILNASSVNYLDDSLGSNVSIYIKTAQAQSNYFTILSYNSDPSIPAYDPFSVGKFITFLPEWEKTELNTGLDYLDWSEIRIHYTDAQISAKGLIESSLKLQSYNPEQGRWEVCSGSSADVTNNFVSCNSTHFSSWGLTGDPVPQEPAQVISSGGGGGGKKKVSQKFLATGGATPTPSVESSEEISKRIAKDLFKKWVMADPSNRHIFSDEGVLESVFQLHYRWSAVNKVIETQHNKESLKKIGV